MNNKSTHPEQVAKVSAYLSNFIVAKMIENVNSKKKKLGFRPLSGKCTGKLDRNTPTERLAVRYLSTA